MNRYCFTLRIDPDQADEYREQHARVWPEMLRALHDTGWRNYSLFLSPDGLLVGYVEAEDLDASQRAMAQLEVNDRWQNAMRRYFLELDGRAPDEGFALLDMVFNLEDQLADLPTT